MKEYTVKVYPNGTKYWYLNGQLHREDGPAIEWANGSNSWCLNGHLHREGGPAVEYADGDKYWYLNGQWHREDGPAIECANGDKEWYLDGQRLAEKEFNARTKAKELTVADIEKLLGHSVKIVKE